MISKNTTLLFLAPKPECVSDPECPTQLACINEKCKNPCYSHTCGRNAECTVKNHRPICVCLVGFVGNPQTICEERKCILVKQFGSPGNSHWRHVI